MAQDSRRRFWHAVVLGTQRDASSAAADRLRSLWLSAAGGRLSEGTLTLLDGYRGEVFDYFTERDVRFEERS